MISFSQNTSIAVVEKLEEEKKNEEEATGEAQSPSTPSSASAMFPEKTGTA